MSTIYNEQDKNIRLTWVYLTGFLVFVIGVGWVFAQAYGNSTILYLAVAFSIIMNLVSYWWSDKIVLKMSGAQRLRPKDGPEAREIYRLVENLAITAGLPTPKIYLINDSALNAFATGRNPEHAVVAMTTGIVQRLEKRELEGVLAHELSHIGNRDILLSTVITVLVGFISILADMFRHSMFFRSRDNDDARANMIFMIIGLVLSILAPISAMLIQLAISRKREFLADSSGALLTRYPEGLASALEKISADPQPLRKVNKATAHMFIANPFKKKSISKFFMTHPDPQERIRRLRAMNNF
jgi:heat shock protein HtpX